MNKWYTMAGLTVCLLAFAYVTSSSLLETVATVTGLLSVWLTAREHIWCWPVGLINVGCFFFMFYDAKLYADMTLQVFFFALSIQGWVVWLTKRGVAKVRPTKRIAAGTMAFYGLIAVAAAWGWGSLLARFTDASIPYLDAFVATLSLLAQYLLSRKVLETWYFWIAVDVLSVGMYLYKGLTTVALLYMIFLAIAVSGLYSWRRVYRLTGISQDKGGAAL